MRDTLEKRFWAKVQKTGENDCWLWLRWVDKDGYGYLSKGSKSEGKIRAHIYSFLLHGGEIPEGYIVEHECNNPPCVNPKHLRATTQRFNVMRSKGPAAVNARKTHCPSQHEYTATNTYWFPTRTGWGRSCCACNKRRPKAKEDWIR
jgi:hypothetical protein